MSCPVMKRAPEPAKAKSAAPLFWRALLSLGADGLFLGSCATLALAALPRPLQRRLQGWRLALALLSAGGAGAVFWALHRSRRNRELWRWVHRSVPGAVNGDGSAVGATHAVAHMKALQEAIQEVRALGLPAVVPPFEENPHISQEAAEAEEKQADGPGRGSRNLVSSLYLQTLHDRILEKLSAGESPVCGLHGPGSVAWAAIRESAAFLGSFQAVVLQLAHPYVAFGVDQYSETRENPLLRAQQTFYYLFRMEFGDLATALRASRKVHSLHRVVTGGFSEPSFNRAAGFRYHANEPLALFWVAATLLDTTVRCLELVFGLMPESAKDAYYQEERVVWHILFGVPLECMPTDWADFQEYFRWMTEVSLERTQAACDDFVLRHVEARRRWRTDGAREEQRPRTLAFLPLAEIREHPLYWRNQVLVEERACSFEEDPDGEQSAWTHRLELGLDVSRPGLEMGGFVFENYRRTTPPGLWPIIALSKVVTAHLLPDALARKLGQDKLRERTRGWWPAIKTLLRVLWPLLPEKLRFLPSYNAARARVLGGSQIDPVGDYLDSLYIGAH